MSLASLQSKIRTRRSDCALFAPHLLVAGFVAFDASHSMVERMLRSVIAGFVVGSAAMLGMLVALGAAAWLRGGERELKKASSVFSMTELLAGSLLAVCLW